MNLDKYFNQADSNKTVEQKQIKTSKRLMDMYNDGDCEIVEAVDYLVEAVTPQGKEFVQQAIYRKCLSFKNIVQAFNYYRPKMLAEQVEEFKEMFL